MESRIIDRKYQLTRLLGQGGMGAVYEARHLGTNRRVALKLIIGDALIKSPDIVTRFQREARASGSIETQHVAQVLDTGVDPDTQNPYMVMEFLAGEDLHQLIERAGAIHPEAALRICAQALLGLQKAHDAGIVHRDIKSANLFLSRRDGGEVLVKLLDFGIAKVKADQLQAGENQGLTRTGSMLGSPLYMSPEQAKGSKHIDHRTDIWSLGVVLYEALCGMTPHGHLETLGELIIAICSEQPRPIQERAPWVAPEVAAIVHRALTHDPNARYQTASAMFEALRALLPQGMGLGESMLAPIPVQMRSYVAPRLSVTPWPVPQLGQSGSGLSSVPATTGAGTTDAGLSRSRGPTGGGSAAKWVVPVALLGVLVVGGGAVVGWKVLAKAPPGQAASAPPSASAVPDPTPAPPASDVAPVPATRTVQVHVTPPRAEVEVDGAPATALDGVVAITGTLGSTHHVKVSLAKRETTVDVVIAESGAVPSQIDLPPPERALAGNHPGAGQNPPPQQQGQNANPPPQNPPPKPPPANPGSPSIDRSFN